MTKILNPIYSGGGVFINNTTNARVQPQDFGKQIYAAVEGRMFDRWINRGLSFTMLGGSPNTLDTTTNHYFWNTQTIRLTTTGTLPTGLAINTTYYIINRTDTTIKLSATKNGTEITITGSGTGTHTMSRYNGYIEGDLIENPVYLIESLHRDEIFTERDLTVTSVTSTTVFTCSGLKNSTNGYYINAIYHNVSSAAKRYVTAYVGSTKTITLNAAHIGLAVGDKIYFTNIYADQRIDESSIDALGIITGGLRSDWKIRASINQAIKVQNLIDQICYETHIFKFTSYNKIRLVAIDSGASIATWGSPLKQNGVELARVDLTPLENIYIDFRLKYAYDYGKNDYTKEYFVNKTGYSPGASLSAEQILCSDANTNYKIQQKFEYSSDYIYDDATALALLKKFVAWHTKQRLLITWVGSVKNYFIYELGDIIKKNYSELIPTGINNSTAFMIFSKVLAAKKKIHLSLIEL